MGSSFSQFSVCFEVLEDLFDDPWIFDSSDDLDGTAAMLTSIDVDVEHAFEALCLYALGCRSWRHVAVRVTLGHHFLQLVHNGLLV